MTFRHCCCQIVKNFYLDNLYGLMGINDYVSRIKINVWNSNVYYVYHKLELIDDF